MLSVADRARRDEATDRIETALDFGWLWLEQFAEEIRNFGNARSYVTVLEIVNLARSEIHEALTTITAAPRLDREFPGFLPRAIRELPKLREEFQTINKAAIKVLADNRRQEQEDQARQRQAQQERDERATRQREERATAAATGYAPISVARQQSDAAALYRKPDADLRPEKLGCGITLSLIHI